MNRLYHPAQEDTMVRLVLLSMATLAIGIYSSEAPVKAAGDLGTLISGNARYVDGVPKAHTLSADDRAELAKGQAPYAIVVTCSDSRCSPELIYDEGMGRIFVVRTAGNVLDSITIGSIEYAVEHLHAPLIMVMGHQACGAVKATVAASAAAAEKGAPAEHGAPAGHGAASSHDETPPNIGVIVGRIMPAVIKAKQALKEGDDIVFKATTENVRQVIAYMLKNSALLKEAKEKGEIKVVGGYYSIANGDVKKVE